MRDRDGPEVVGRPTHESEDAAGSERQDTPIAVQNLLRNGSTKPNAVLDALFEPQKLNGREIARADLVR